MPTQQTTIQNDVYDSQSYPQRMIKASRARTNCTTLDAEGQQYNDIRREVHIWFSNYFNSTYSGTDEAQGTIRGVNNDDNPHMIAFNKWLAKKGK
eukprot:2424332-Amphidinium_carterae.1